MSLDLNKLQKVKHKGSTIVARCPACAEEGHDRQGNHLFIAPDGRFGCVLNPGEIGRSHRQKIFGLVGIKEDRDFTTMHIKPVQNKESRPEVIESNVLGRLGHIQTNVTELSKVEEKLIDKKIQVGNKSVVPNVLSVPEKQGEVDWDIWDTYK